MSLKSSVDLALFTSQPKDNICTVTSPFEKQFYIRSFCVV